MTHGCGLLGFPDLYSFKVPVSLTLGNAASVSFFPLTCSLSTYSRTVGNAATSPQLHRSKELSHESTTISATVPTTTTTSSAARRPAALLRSPATAQLDCCVLARPVEFDCCVFACPAELDCCVFGMSFEVDCLHICMSPVVYHTREPQLAAQQDKGNGRNSEKRNLRAGAWGRGARAKAGTNNARRHQKTRTGQS